MEAAGGLPWERQIAEDASKKVCHNNKSHNGWCEPLPEHVAGSSHRDVDERPDAEDRSATSIVVAGPSIGDEEGGE